MPIIDAHVHLYPSEINRDPVGWAAMAGESHWATLCTRKRKNSQPVQAFPSLEELLRSMDAAGVSQAILLGWYWEHPETCRLQNRLYAKCVSAHPDRLMAFATVHPRVGEQEAIRELQQCREQGLVGVGELSPHSQGVAVDDAAFNAVLAQAGEWDMPVNLHVTDPDSRDYPGRVATPLQDFVRWAQTHPKTKFILAHWGGRLPLVETRPLSDNIWFDTAASPLLYEQTFWREFVNRVGADRIIFGSDHPLNLYPAIDSTPDMERLVAEVHRSELTAPQLKALLSENVQSLLRRGPRG